MSENNAERTMDLSGEDVDIDNEELETLGDAEEPEETDEFDAQAEGKAEAKRVLNAVEGETENERAANAIDAKQESLQSMAQQYQTAQQNIQSMEQRLEGLDHTVEQIENADDGEGVFQNLEGGVIVEVSPGRRDEVRDDVQDARDGLAENLEELEGQMEALERGVQKNQAAIQFLELYRDMNDE